MKVAIITGVTGQDGAYLLSLLLNKGYKVYGIYRSLKINNLWRLEELGVRHHPDFHLIEHDMMNLDASIALISRVQLDEIYNLAAQSSVATSFAHPHATAHLVGLGALNLLEAIRVVNPAIRLFQASTSEMFGKSKSIPQSEETPFNPCSPYAVAKLHAHWVTVNYRDSYHLFASSGILFNHESPFRGREFVTRKIAESVAQIRLGTLDVLELGNLNAMRDWGFAQEYVEGMWRMLQAEEPDTFVLATNRSESVRDFVRMAFKGAGIFVEFSGTAEQEIAVVSALPSEPLQTSLKIGQIVARVNPAFFRPIDAEIMRGNAEKARAKLGWVASSTLEQLCQMMVTADLKRNALNKDHTTQSVQ